MAALTITANDVNTVSGNTAEGDMGATATAGQAVYKDTADSDKLKLADKGVAASAVVAGIMVVGASSVQRGRYQTDGEIDIGATVTLGERYFLGAAGAIIPSGDLASNDYVAYLGTGSSSTNILLSLHNTGIQVA